MTYIAATRSLLLLTPYRFFSYKKLDLTILLAIRALILRTIFSPHFAPLWCVWGGGGADLQHSWHDGTLV